MVDIYACFNLQSSQGHSPPQLHGRHAALVYVSETQLSSHSDGTLEKVHIINIYIHADNSNRRHRAIISRTIKAEVARFCMKNDTPVQPTVAMAMKRKNSSSVSNNSSARNTQYVSLPNVQQVRCSALHQASVSAAHWQSSLPLLVMQTPPPPASSARQGAISSSAKGSSAPQLGHVTEIAKLHLSVGSTS
jgi:hypothetical protein